MSAAETLLLGASGQIGQAIVTQWSEAEGPLRCVSRRKKPDWLQLDLYQDPLPDCAYILSSGPLDACVAALRRAPALPSLRRVVAFSSTSVMSKAKSPSARERQLAERLRQSEQGLREWCTAHGVEWVLIRPTLVHGGRNRNLQRVARWLMRYGCVPCQSPARGMRQPVHADELAWLARRCRQLPQAAGHGWVAAGGECLSYREMLERVRQQVGRGRLCPLPAWMLQPLRWWHPEAYAMLQRQQQDLCFDDAETRKVLGWNPGPFRPRRDELL